jgi:hypothetical protein
MYRIRFHGRGGQGMKTASQVLGTALFLEGFEVQDAPRYGAERRGAPIFAYVRAQREPMVGSVISISRGRAAEQVPGCGFAQPACNLQGCAARLLPLRPSSLALRPSSPVPGARP